MRRGCPLTRALCVVTKVLKTGIKKMDTKVFTSHRKELQ